MTNYKWKVTGVKRDISLENFIYAKLGSWTHRQVKEAIDHKSAFVNGKNVFIAKWNLKPGDLVQFVPRLTTKRPGEVKSVVKLSASNRYRFIEVLFEDKHLLVVNKPAFVEFEEFALMVQTYLERRNGERSFPYLGQMHRLDKETTGAMVFTKKKIANSLADQFREHTIQKIYVALVTGAMDQENGEIRKSLEKGEFGEGKRVRISPHKSGLAAVTRFRILERYEKASLLSVQILTGRTHQIRVHLADKGYPLVGDKLYHDLIPVKIPFKRHVLHAEVLEFKHPLSGEKIKIKAPWPKDLQELVDKLRMGEL